VGDRNESRAAHWQDLGCLPLFEEEERSILVKAGVLPFPNKETEGSTSMTNAGVDFFRMARQTYDPLRTPPKPLIL
jgi:hypothetical protein